MPPRGYPGGQILRRKNTTGEDGAAVVFISIDQSSGRPAISMHSNSTLALLIGHATAGKDDRAWMLPWQYAGS
jgi:hypothetical protein